jgi:hypothetical protein
MAQPKACEGEEQFERNGREQSWVVSSTSRLTRCFTHCEHSLNMAELAGLSQQRDTSSYYWGPMRGRRMTDPRYEDD